MQEHTGPIIFTGNKPFDLDNLIPSAPPKARPFIKLLVILVFFALAAVVAYSLFNFVQVFLKQNQKLASNKIVPISDGQIVLSSSVSKFQVGQIVPVKVKIQTGGHTVVGVDISLKFDPKYLSISSGSASFKKGTAFLEYPVTNIDSNEGVVRISGIASLAQIGFNGAGEFGVLNFIAKARGHTKISLNFVKDTTTDSNMLEFGSGDDILNFVNELSLNID